ncbi:flagellar brake protein [Candidatus Endoriftia persephonae]|uniref:Flagellar brake protein n=1 Tax=Candidatus Endoriftia persephonae TaxID=393765 RepID=A0A9J6ZSU8_9GAMM|nr:flagellar brake protein [Candidatus Endoriftia persephone]USF86131.1 flagellar brake protein [Candidatus Endoriftia persephone]
MSDIIRTLQIGDTLQLQHAPPSDIPDRYGVKLIGYLPNESLVITTPRKQGKAILVREGQNFTVRVLQGSNVFGFVSRVMHAAARPYPHLHLAYPEDVASAVVRNAPRVSTTLDTKVRNTNVADTSENHLAAKIADLSNSGARLITKKPIGSIGDMIQIQLNIDVCNGSDSMQIMGEIKNLREFELEGQGSQFVHGVQFKGVNRFQQLLLCAYVLSQITTER